MSFLHSLLHVYTFSTEHVFGDKSQNTCVQDVAQMMHLHPKKKKKKLKLLILEAWFS